MISINDAHLHLNFLRGPPFYFSFRRSSVDEVIGLLSAPAADGSFEDEGATSQYNPAQFDSWRNSLTKVRLLLQTRQAD